MFYLDANRDLAVALIPKAGLTTFRAWLGRSFVEVSNDQARQVSRRVAFIRHPLERLKSCYSFFYWLDEYGTQHQCEAPTDSWQAFVDYALTHSDCHWQPQAEIIGDAANIIHRFENINRHWEKYRPGIMDRLNMSSRRPTPDYRTDDILDKYSDDMSLWSNAT